MVRAARLDADHRDPRALARAVPRARRAPDRRRSSPTRNIALIEQPEYKRRWNADSWDDLREARSPLAGSSTASKIRAAGRSTPPTPRPPVGRRACRPRPRTTPTSCRSPSSTRGRPDFDVDEARRRPRASRRPSRTSPRLRYNGVRPAQARGLGADVGPPAPRGRGRERSTSPSRRSTPARTSAKATTGRSAASSTSRRSASSPAPAPSAPPTRLPSSAGPAGTTSSAPAPSPRYYLPDEDRRGLGRRPPHSPPRRPRRASPLAEAVARRPRPRLRRTPRHLVRAASSPKRRARWGRRWRRWGCGGLPPHARLAPRENRVRPRSQTSCVRCTLVHILESWSTNGTPRRPRPTSGNTVSTSPTQFRCSPTLWAQPVKTTTLSNLAVSLSA